MKKFALITILLLTSCAKDSVNYESSLVFTDDIYYEKETDQPYSGPIFALHESGMKREEGYLVEGTTVVI